MKMKTEDIVSALRSASKSARMMHTPTFSDLMADAADFIEELNEQLLDLAHKYLRLSARTEWIPVSKMLPYQRFNAQHLVNVIVAYDTGYVEEALYVFYDGLGKYKHGWQTDMKDHITHWKFFPEAPTVGRDEYGE